MKHVLCLSWSFKFLSLLLVMLSCLSATAQVNSGSNGSDGAFNPTGNVTINMADHPDGIYHYTSVNIPSGVTVTFTPNANNTPVVWLVQGTCVVTGVVDVSGKHAAGVTGSIGGLGGPGGWGGASSGDPLKSGLGPGGGLPMYGGSFGSLGREEARGLEGGQIYGNRFLLPLLGGSGGGGYSPSPYYGYLGGGAGGGGGAILIAASASVILDGQILSIGGNGNGVNIGGWYYGSGAGSGGGIRVVSPTFQGTGALIAKGGGGYSYNYNNGAFGGNGRVRIDTFQNTFGGSITGEFSQGFQPIIIPASGQGVQLGIQSIGGVSVAGSPNGVLANPDVILPAQQTNPMNVVVNCSNLPMNTTITVTVRPANGADIVATGTNSSGTQTASTATIPVNMPRGGGIIFAKCVSGVAGSASVSGDDYGKNIAQTGWTAHGERFAQMEITAGIGSSQQVAYITESGKRYTLPAP